MPQRLFRIVVLTLLALSSVTVLAVGGGACSRSQEPTWKSGWRSTEPLIVPRTSASAVIANGYLYVVGGIRGGGLERGFVKSVEFAKLQPDGSVTGWRLTSSLNEPRGFLKAVTADGYIYAIGGETFNNGLVLLNTVERASMLPNGSLGPWQYIRPMATPRRSPTAVVSHGAIYVMGGYNGLFLRSVERAMLAPNGTIGAWEFLPSQLTTDRYIHGAGLVGDNIYIIGGHIQDVGGGKSSAEWTRILPDGSLQPWQLTETTNISRFLASTISAGPYVYTLGGYQRNYLASVERSRVREDGTLSPWVDTTSLSRPKEGAALAVAIPSESRQGDRPRSNGNHRRLYVIGGSAHGAYLRDVEWAVVNEEGELGYWATSSSPDGSSSELSPPPLPARPSLEEAHSPMGAGEP